MNLPSYGNLNNLRLKKHIYTDTEVDVEHCMYAHPVQPKGKVQEQWQ